nr:hypothetical protein [Tanacetum cinerariifolium]
MTLKFAETHNMVAFLEKPTKSKRFKQIVDFLSAHTLREAQIHARVDGKEIIIIELSVRRDLRLVDEEGVDCLSKSTIFENLELMRKVKRKNSQVPQLSVSTENVVNKAVYKELDDRLPTPNKASSPGTTLGGGPRCQEAMKDTIAQTRFENVSKLSNVSLLAEVRVDSSEDEQSLGEDASKQRRKIHDIDADKDVTLVNDQDDAEMFDVNDLHGEEDKGKGIMVEEHVKLKKKDQIRLDEEVVLKLQAELHAEFNKEQRITREKAEKEQEANISVIEK